MEQEVLTGMGLSMLFGFARWRFPTIPPRVAEAGLVSGILLLLVGVFMPQLQFSLPAIAFFVLGCVAFGLSAHFALKENPLKAAQTKTSAAAPAADTAPFIRLNNVGDGEIKNNTIIGGPPRTMLEVNKGGNLTVEGNRHIEKK